MTFLCSFFSFFLTHLCGSISGNTSFRYLPDSSPMKRKIVFFFIIWTLKHCFYRNPLNDCGH